ncbi:hypothetical protein [Halobiforma nitratireducens]|uniref:DUF1102 domain-containing protein n=1 Tax=Halobiforma nitratireducens JCM 10879 TaxID=1227454 RepID=M0LH13_9EURY|nr:hypothetical protein [Halobiforma nitratireducens]EMA32373.1 hypothetical protein C446_14714 [Halobiforma nitratireducens JCM 10879]
MKRRSFIVAAGGVAAGGLTLGTGAFSTVEAERTVEVEIAHDAEAYLSIEFGPEVSEISEQFTEDVGNQIALDINSLANVDGTGDGANMGAVTTFDELFRITNAGSDGEDVYFWAEFPEDDDETLLEDIFLYPESDNGSRLEGDEEQLELATGEQAYIGLAVEKDSGDTTPAYDPDDPVVLHADTDGPS